MSSKIREFECYRCEKTFTTNEPLIIHIDETGIAPDEELVSLCDECSITVDNFIENEKD